MGDRLERGLVMLYEEAAGIISYGRRLGGEYITFIGSEPTLHPELPRSVDQALEVGYSQVMIDSNGIGEEAIIRIAPEKFHNISISLDGARAETHNRLRGRGTFDKAVVCIQNLVSQRYTVRVICAISQNNIQEGPAVLSLCEDIGVNLVNLHVFPRKVLEQRTPPICRLALSSGLTVNVHPLFIRDLVDGRVEEMRESWKEKGALFTLGNLETRGGLVNVGEMAGTPTQVRSWCSRIKNMLSILCDGRAVICCADWKHSVVWGSLLDSSIEEIFNCEELVRYREAMARGMIDTLSPCRDCYQADIEVGGKNYTHNV